MRRPDRPSRPRPAGRRRGFSLIEVLTAVFILALLISLSVYGLRKVLQSQQANATRITLHNARALFQEFDTATGLTRDTGHWLFQVPPPYGDGSVFTVWSGDNTPNTHVIDTNMAANGTGSPTSIPPIGGMSVDFWHSPMRYAYNATTGTAGGSITNASPGAALLCPTVPVTAEIYANGTGRTDRMTAPGILNMQIAMRLFGTTPIGRSSIAALPTGTLLVPDYVPGATYAAGNVVKYAGDGTTPFWRKAFNTVTKVDVNPPGTPSINNANWTLIQPGQQPDPLLLDVWHNPVMIAPAGGLIGVWTGGAAGATGAIYHVQDPKNPPASVTTILGVTILLSSTNVAGPITSPDGKAFFVSAGPDGDFTTGDDNVYSFEN